MGWIGLDGWIHAVEDEVIIGIMPKYFFPLLEGFRIDQKSKFNRRSVGCRGRLDPVREQFKKWDKDGKGDHESLLDGRKMDGENSSCDALGVLDEI